MSGHDLLAQPLEAHTRRRRDEPLVSLLERTDEALVILAKLLGEGALDPGEQRPLARLPADVDEPVVRDADERRRQHGHERLVVVAVVEQPLVREQVDHLLLAEVPATGRTVRR